MACSKHLLITLQIQLLTCNYGTPSQNHSYNLDRNIMNSIGLVYTACYERTEPIIYIARSGTLVCIFDLYVTTVSEPNLLVEL